MKISKRILSDEDMNPVAVQIDYDDWLAIEQQLNWEVPAPSPSAEFKHLLEDFSNIWSEGDGLEYQRRIHAEWANPWEARDDDEEEADL